MDQDEATRLADRMIGWPCQLDLRLPTAPMVLSSSTSGFPLKQKIESRI